MDLPDLRKKIARFAAFSVTGLGGLVLPAWCHAEDAAEEFGELPVVLSASRLRQPLVEAPSAVTVIDRQMIEASGARQIADLMRYVPGAVVGYNDGNRPVVALQGLSGTYASGVQVLVDGVSVYTPLWGGMQWEELPLSLDDLERIEVIRGPNAAVFGPNSFAGVINIITRYPAANSDWKLTANAGNRGVADLSLSRSSSLENGTNYRVTFGQRASDGFDTRPDTQRQYFGNFRSEYQVDSKDSLHFALYAADNKKDNGDYGSTGSSQVPHPNYSNKLDVQLRWTSAISSEEEWWVQYYHQQSRTTDDVNVNYRDSRFWNKYFTALAALVPNPLPYAIDSGYETQRDGVEYQHTFRFNEAVRAVYGAETRRDLATSKTYLGSEPQSAILTRAYGNFEWNFHKDWTLHLASMVEKNSLADTGVSSKLAFTWQPIDGHVFRLGVSTALRTPSIYEKRANISYPIPASIVPFIPASVVPAIGGSPNEIRVWTRGRANNEKLSVEEIGYSVNFPEWNVVGEARWAWSHYKDLMGVDGNGDFYNKDKAEVESGDLTVKWTPNEATMIRIALNKTNISSSTDPATYNQSAPKDTVSLLWDQRVSYNWRLSANYQRVGEMHWTDAGNTSFNPANPIIPAIDYLTLRLGRRLNLTGFSESELAVVVQNALGNHRDYWAGVAANGQKETIAPRISFLQFVGRF